MKNRLLSVSAMALLATAVALMVVALSMLAKAEREGDGEPLAIGTPLPTQAPTSTPPPAATLTPTPAPQGDPRLAALAISRLVVPKIGVNASIVTLGILPDGTMDAPRGPTEVAWYTFSARPGQVGNVVMAGHLDYANYGAAVFYRLRDLRPGDELQVVLADGTEVAYAVESVTEYEEATAPVADIVGRTPNEAITLITCAGSFDRSNLLYNKRLVVRGARVLS
ncbi:MAG TPA: sortase [Dehalococcoidia bacterium]|nr:sortase [Dehalococcoidia bacterium]